MNSAQPFTRFPGAIQQGLAGRLGRLILAFGFLAYLSVLAVAVQRWELPPFGARAAALLVVAVIADYSAKGLLAVAFWEALARQGRRVRIRASFAAALIGTGVARLVPAGGALAASVMGWAVRDEDDQAAGAALRTTMLSYGGLLLLTGAAITWAASTGRDPLRLSVAVAVGVALIVAGSLVLLGGRWLSRLVAILPGWLRRHFAPTAGNERITNHEIVLITSKIVLEATVLWIVLSAFVVELSPTETMVTFGFAKSIGSIPVSPGGLGLVEGGLLGALTGLGFASEAVVAPVLIYRVIDYWMAIGVGIVLAGRTVGRSADP